MSKTGSCVFIACVLLTAPWLAQSARAADSCPESPRPLIVMSAQVKPPDQEGICRDRAEERQAPAPGGGRGGFRRRGCPEQLQRHIR